MINRSIFDFMDKEGGKALNDHLKRLTMVLEIFMN